MRLKLHPKGAEGVIDHEGRAREVLQRLARPDRPILGFDTETIGWDPDEKLTPYERARCALFSLSDGEDAWALDAKFLGLFRPLFEDPAVTWRGVNLKFDQVVLRNHSIRLGGKWEDARIMARLWNVTTLPVFGLKEMSRAFLGREQMKFRDVVKLPRNRRPTTEDCLRLDPYLFARYSRDDALNPWDLCALLRKKLKQLPWHGSYSMADFHDDFEEPFTHVLARMEERGIRVNQERLEAIRVLVERERAELQDHFERLREGPINLDSPDQVGELLFGHLKLDPILVTDTARCGVCGKKATKRTNYLCAEHGALDLRRDVPATNKFALERMAERGDPVVKQLIRYRKINQLWKMFLPALSHPCSDGKVRTTWNQGSVETWRLSSSAPPLQTVPRSSNDNPDHEDPDLRGFGLRTLFEPDDGYCFLVADESQIELRLGAHLSGDPVMIETYRRNGDIHAEAAHAIYRLDCTVDEVKTLHPDKRDDAKPLNFGIFYGMGWKRIRNQYRVSEERAKELLNNYLERFVGIQAYKRQREQEARVHGFVRSLLGRYRHAPFIHRTDPFSERYKNDEKVRSRYQGEFREIINQGPQGGAADILQTCMLILDGELVEWHHLQEDRRMLDLGGQQLLQIHDELVLQIPIENAPEGAKVLEDVMRDPIPGLAVPVFGEAGWGKTWPSAKK